MLLVEADGAGGVFGVHVETGERVANEITADLGPDKQVAWKVLSVVLR